MIKQRIYLHVSHSHAIIKNTEANVGQHPIYINFPHSFKDNNYTLFKKNLILQLVITYILSNICVCFT